MDERQLTLSERTNMNPDFEAYEPAFPSPTEFDADGNVVNDGHYGITIRDYFAAMAMQGLWANPQSFGPLLQQNPRAIACWAVETADALIAELAK